MGMSAVNTRGDHGSILSYEESRQGWRNVCSSNVPRFVRAPAATASRHQRYRHN